MKGRRGEAGPDSEKYVADRKKGSWRNLRGSDFNI